MFRRMFFARKIELMALVSALQSATKLYATCADLMQEKTRRVYDDLLELPGFRDNASRSDLLEHFLVGSHPSFVIEEIPQRRGGVRYSVDRNGNPDTWHFVVGGEVQDGILVPGDISGPISGLGQKLEPVFRAATSGFLVEGPFLVSPEARKLAQAGGRLVANGNPDSPTEYDLSIRA